MRAFFCITLVIAVTLFSHSVYSQGTVKGLLLNEENNAPIPFANIGILNTPTGTITDDDGSFEIVIPEGNAKDSVLFSALGFERKSILASSLLKEKNATIYLKEHTVVLKNVTVKTRKLKPAIAVDVGNTYHNVGSLYVDSVAGGAAMALLIENPRVKFNNLSLPYFVTGARLNIAYNSLDFFRVRIRLLSVDPQTGLPGSDLFHESVIETSKQRKGWLTFDLSKYTARINSASFYVVFEWIMEADERKELIEHYREFKRLYPKKVTTDTATIDGEKVSFTKWQGYRAGTSFGSSSIPSVTDGWKCYYRNNSYGKWRRSSYAIAATVTIVNYD